MLPKKKAIGQIFALAVVSAMIVLAPWRRFFGAAPEAEYPVPSSAPAGVVEAEPTDPALTTPPESSHVSGRQVAATADDAQSDDAHVHRCLVEVSVLDAGSGATVGGAAISCEGVVVAETNETGQATFRAAVGRWLTVRATTAGRCPGIKRIRAEEDGEHVEAVIKLVPAASVYGMVRGPDMLPARDAEVVLRLGDPGLVRPVTTGVDGLASGSSARTDAKGAFRFDGIGSRKGLWRARIVVLHEGAARFESESFEVRNGQEVGPIICDLSEGARIRGRVTAWGVSAGATVFLAGVGQPVETDTEGAYELDHVPPGSVTVGVALLANPWVRASIPLDITAGEERVLDVALDYDVRVFSGVVSTPDGIPVDGVRVWCETQGFHDLKPVRYFGRTNENGAYRIEAPVRAGETELVYTLHLERWEDDCAVVAEPDQMIVNLTCAGSAVVEVMAADSTNDQPLKAFDPVWFPAGDPAGDRVLLDYGNPDDGQLVAVVPAGSGELQVSLPGYQPLRIPLTTYAGDNIDLGRIRLDPMP